RETALRIPGVVAVVTPDDMPDLSGAVPDLHEPGTLHNPYCDLNVVPSQKMFPSEVKYVGEHFAAVIGETPYAAADGAEAVEVEYDLLPVVPSLQHAMAKQSPRVHQEYENTIAHLKHEIGSVEDAFSDADVVIERRLKTQSLKSMAMECRGSAAAWDEKTQTLTVWSTSQLYYLIRSSLSPILQLPPDKIR